jgi:thiamine biosynthesis lipoprotein
MTAADWPRRHTVAMSCAAEITADPGTPASALDAAVHRVHELEAHWSRFIASSDIGRLNDAGGRPVRVDHSTIRLLAAMASGTIATGGAFDPSVLDAMVAFGRGPAWFQPATTGSVAVAPVRDRWFADVEVDPVTGTVRLPPGLHLDPGGIGKGLAADLVVENLIAAGARSALVSIGGDVCIGGRAIRPGGWRVDIGAVERDAAPIDRIRLAAGAVATSGTTRRPLRDREGSALGHVIDPATRRPAQNELVQVSVAAGSGAWAEVMTKAVLVDGPDVAHDLQLAAMWIGADGVRHDTAAWRALR